jgi:carboxypeptidase Q
MTQASPSSPPCRRGRAGWLATTGLIWISSAMSACTGEPGSLAFAEPGDLPDLVTLQTIIEESLERSLVGIHADTLLDQIGARISAFPSGQDAQDFVERRMRAMGLDRVQQLTFPLLAWDRGSAILEVEVDGIPLEGPWNILSLGHVPSGDQTAPLLNAGFGTAEELEPLGDAVAGTIVLVDVSSPPDYGRFVHRSEKVTLATRAGAVGFIQVNDREGDLIPIGVATLGDEEAEILAAAVDLDSGNRLRAALETHERVEVRLALDNWMERATSANVVGDLQGTTDEIVLIGAHLDSWDLATGALDNGSGSLAVLDAALALAAHVRETGLRPRRTLRFAFWMGEELGLYGSRAYVEDRLREGTLDRYAAILNMDVVGDPTGLGAIGRPGAAPLLAHVRAAAEAAGLSISDTFSSGGGLYSDHQPFMMQGIPIVTISSRQRPEAAGVGHTTADTRDVLDEPGISRAAALAAALLWTLAQAPELNGTIDMARWPEDEIGVRLDALGVRDPLERAGEWRWR